MEEDTPASPEPECPASPVAEGEIPPDQNEQGAYPQIPLDKVVRSWHGEKRAGVTKRTGLWKPVHNIHRGDSDCRQNFDKHFSENLALPRNNRQEEFTKMFRRGELDLLYRNRPVYANSTSEVVKLTRCVYQQLPQLRSYVLHFVGRLVHEASHITFSKIEPPGVQTDPTNLIKAVKELLQLFETTVRQSKDIPFVLDILREICKICSELYERNERRPSFGQVRNRDPDSVNEVFKKSEAVCLLLRLLDFCFEFLLAEDRIELGLLAFLEAENANSNFKWMWSHLLYRYTGVISKKILIVGILQFEKQMNSTLEHLEQNSIDFKQRFDILVDIITFLSRQHREMREIVQELFKKGMNAKAINGKLEDHSLVFLFKLTIYSGDLARFIAESLKDFASPANVILGIQQLNGVSRQAMLDNFDHLTFLRQLIGSIDISIHAPLFSTLMELCLDSTIFSDAKKLDVSLIRSIKEGALKALDEIIMRLVPLAHASNNFDSSLFFEYSNGHRLQTCIEASLSNQTCSPTLIRFFHVLTLTFGDQKGVEIICRYIFTIRDPQHFHPLCAFLASITPFYPNLMQSAYDVLIDRRAIMENERKERGDSSFATSLLWLMNLRVLLEFERNAQETSDEMKYLGLHPGVHTGSLMMGILSWTIEQIEEAIEKGNTRRIADAASCIERLISVLAPAEDKIPLIKSPGKQRIILFRSRDIYKLSMQLAKVLQLALYSLNYEPENKTGHDLLGTCATFRETISKFFHNQMSHLCSYYFTWFLMSFVENCLQEAKEMFGETIDFATCVPSSLNSYAAIVMEDEEISLFDNVGILAERKKANQLAHSGTIGKGARKAKPPLNEHEHLRRHVFLDYVNILIRSAPQGKQLKAARSLALLLVDRLCGDAVNGSYSFADFEVEKEMISRYVKVGQRMATPIGEGLLTIVCDFTPCLNFATPILKAAILETMALLDASFERLERRPTDQILVKIDRWFRIGIKGGLLPSCMLSLAEILPICSAHEAFLILNEIYSYLKLSTHFQVEVERCFARAMSGETLRKPELMRTTSLLELLVAILQRDIAHRGKYLPLLLKAFSKVEADVPAFEVVDEIQEPDPEN
ncbi:unnamed protein product, partial [Mesorhabditis belari]|uniref:Uncharacterized protein n=1 Tax=Mesorhabditis belari TaxID=2138241 RepID=A0AAF3J984_9BILA